MGSEVLSRHKARKRTIAAAIGASVLVLLFVAGLAFANSVGASQVAANAAALHWTNAALGTSSLTRAALVQSSTFVELEGAGLVTNDDVVFAVEQAETAHEELVGLEEIAAESPSLAHLAHFNDAAAQTLETLRAGDHAGAEEVILGDLELSYQSLSASLASEQQAIQEEIGDNTAAAARTNGYIVFVLTLAIPAAAVTMYWWIARRQVREYRIKSEVEIEAERAVSRAKDSFIAGLSHELRTPLTSIYGFAEILSEDDGQQNRDAAQIIANEAAEMSRMVDDLLTASRLESTGVEIELGPTRIQDIVDSAVTPFERAGAEILRDPSLEVALADGGRLRHVLVNLLSNAVRHGGSRMGIEVSSGEGTVEIEVWDDGSGVPEEQVERLFERFVHDGAQPLLAGSIGLGLAVASRLTSMMGGSLSYQRFAGKTFFTVRLPAFTASDPDGDENESVADVIRAMSA